MCPKPVEACSLSTHYACIYNFEYIYSGWGLRNSHNTQVPNISMETSWVIWSKHIKRLNLLNRIWMDFFLCNVYGWIVHQIFVHYPALNLINIQAQKSKHTTPPLLGYPRIKGKSSWAHHSTNLWKVCLFCSTTKSGVDQMIIIIRKYFIFIRQCITGHLRRQSLKVKLYCEWLNHVSHYIIS